MPGQADDLAPSLDDIAAFMGDNPEADLPEDEDLPNPEGSDEDNPEGTDEPGDDPDDSQPDPDEDDPDEGDEDGGRPDDSKTAKYEVTVKGEDGAEIKQKVSLAELQAGYQRHADYTRKTQELSQQRQQALEIVQRREEQAQKHYQDEAAIALRTVYELAGLMSPQELAALAATNPQEAFQEEARQRAVIAKIEEVRGRVLADREQGTVKQQQAQHEAAQQAWEVLANPSKVGIRQEPVKTDEVKPLFEAVNKHFKIPMERFKNITDPLLVLMMRSAVRFEEAKTKAAGMDKKGGQGKEPRVAQREPAKPSRQLPPPRQSAPRESKQAETLNRKFSSGRAKVNDLAAFIGSHNL